MIDRKKLEQARGWARATTGLSMKEVHAAEEVIQSLPDEWIDADKLRDVIDAWHHVLLGGDIERHLRRLLPAPPAPRTLADMSEEEVLECQWAQADVETLGETKRVVITHLSPSLSSARTLDQKGVQGGYEFYQITPLPDLPRMNWPGEEPEETRLGNNSEVKEGHPSTGWKPDKKSAYEDDGGTRWDFGADVGSFENGWKCEDGCCSCLDSLPEQGEPYYPVRKGER